MSDVTQLLQAMGRGDFGSSNDLLAAVYEELRKLAGARMANEAAGQTLQPTALVHEVWLRLSQQTRTEWKNREQFYAVATEVMRRLLVDRARRRHARKHGGGMERVELDGFEVVGPENHELVLQVHEALEELGSVDPTKAEVVKLRFFVGLENAEIATLLGNRKGGHVALLDQDYLAAALAHRLPAGLGECPNHVTPA